MVNLSRFRPGPIKNDDCRPRTQRNAFTRQARGRGEKQERLIATKRLLDLSRTKGNSSQNLGADNRPRKQPCRRVILSPLMGVLKDEEPAVRRHGRNQPALTVRHGAITGVAGRTGFHPRMVTVLMKMRDAPGRLGRRPSQSKTFLSKPAVEVHWCTFRLRGGFELSERLFAQLPHPTKHQRSRYMLFEI